MQNRLKKLKSVLGAKNLEAIIVTNPTNIFYLSGFRGVSPLEREAILIVKSDDATLITARLYQAETLKIKSKNLLIKIAAERNEINELIKDSLNTPGYSSSDSALQKSREVLKRSSQLRSNNSVQAVGFEEHDLKFSEFKEFKKILKGKKLIPVRHLIENLRIIKTADEIKNIERAQLISQKAFEQIIKTIKVGQREAEIADTLIEIIKSLGAPSLAFAPIIASGPNSAKPHHVTGSRKIKRDEVLLFDFGAKYKDYSADLSRTIFVGRARDEQAKIYAHVAAAQQKAIAKIKSGIRASHAHKTATSHFKKNGLDQYFLHSLGHGIGLEVHEKPSISRKSKDTLEEGMVFSVEPGLYFPQWGGVRIEDLITIKNGRAKILGKPAQFIQIWQK